MKTLIFLLILILTAGLPVCAQPTGEMKMEQRLTLITLGVSNLETSTEF